MGELDQHGEELGRLDGFGHVRVEARVAGARAVFLTREGRERHRRDVPPTAGPSARTRSINA